MESPEERRYACNPDAPRLSHQTMTPQRFAPGSKVYFRIDDGSTAVHVVAYQHPCHNALA